MSHPGQLGFYDESGIFGIKSFSCKREFTKEPKQKVFLILLANHVMGGISAKQTARKRDISKPNNLLSSQRGVVFLSHTTHTHKPRRVVGSWPIHSFLIGWRAKGGFARLEFGFGGCQEKLGVRLLVSSAALTLPPQNPQSLFNDNDTKEKGTESVFVILLLACSAFDICFESEYQDTPRRERESARSCTGWIFCFYSYRLFFFFFFFLFWQANVVDEHSTNSNIF